MEQQLRGEKVSVLSYICHNSGGQLLKKRQSEMWLTARLFRPVFSAKLPVFSAKLHSLRDCATKPIL
ncbi:hypothetical protein T08_11644 [Trichinella sp. T8]|nr:hypothetical protein T08_11644 [Trichinella sp. T8]